MPPRIPPKATQVVVKTVNKIRTTLWNKLRDRNFLRDKTDEIVRDQDPNALESKSTIDVIFNRDKIRDKINNFFARLAAKKGQAALPDGDTPPMWYRDP